MPIVAFGTGECKVAFLTEVANTNLAGGFNHIRHEPTPSSSSSRCCRARRTSRRPTWRLQLWLSPELHVRELYRTRPEILFVGDLEPDANNQVDRCGWSRWSTARRTSSCSAARCRRGRPTSASASPRRACSTTCRARACTDQTVETNIVVEFTADAARASERSGDVRRVLARAEVQRQVLFLQSKIDAPASTAAATATRRSSPSCCRRSSRSSRTSATRRWPTSTAPCRRSSRRKGTISQEMLNRSLAASSRAEELVIAQDIDF